MKNILKSMAYLTVPSFIIYILVIGYFYFNQTNIVYKYSNNKFEKDKIEQLITGIKFENTKSGFKYGFKNSNNGQYIIYYHGRSGNMYTSATNAQYFDKKGFGTIICSYPQFDENIGVASKQSLEIASKECFDVLNKKQISHKNTTVHAVSMGAYFASYAANGFEIKKLALISPMGSLSESAAVKYPYLPIKSIIKNDLVTYNNFTNMKGMLEIYYHFGDFKTPIQQSYKIFAAYKAEEEFKKLYTLRDNISGDNINYHGDELHNINFVVETIAGE